jgi:hypothetical protein
MRYEAGREKRAERAIMSYCRERESRFICFADLFVVKKWRRVRSKMMGFGGL